MMQGKSRHIVMSVLSLSLLLPATASAGGVPGPDKERAKVLRARAEALFDQPKEWRRAAKLLEQSAELRTADDAEAFECLLYAGRIRAAVGDSEAAKRLLERAAEQALARGAVRDAAQAYTDAAFAAKAAHDAPGVIELIEKARLLTGSPLLSDRERNEILARLA